MQRIGIQPLEQERELLPDLPRWMARLLLFRGVRTPEAARAFLHPDETQLCPPLQLPGMARAVEILRSSAQAGQSVAVYGDYDVDGVCACAILVEALTELGIQAKAYIPDRHEEGYGLNTPAVEALSRDFQVLVTVDCGITSLAEVRAAREAGMRVIVTDHHRPGAELPAADAVVSPLLEDYPFPSLCGAGVAWKVAKALLGERANAWMELAALATVADLVPLLGENRALVSLGLAQLAQTARPGLRALMRVAGIRERVTSEQVAFQLAPRMNACGRMESAQTALELLCTWDSARAEALALRLDTLNQQRKAQEADVIAQAEAQVRAMDLVQTRAIVVSGAGWNSGVVGLAAGRIAEKYAYPTVALAVDGDLCVGSARSAGNVDIHQALSECADLFLRFGGHKQAAGLTMPRENLPAFTERLSQAVEKQTEGKPIFSQVLCDGEMSLSQVTEETVGMLAKLEPFGMGNPTPRFLCEGAEALSLRAVGAEGKHLKCFFRQGDALRDGILFGGGELAGQTGVFTLAMTPTLNVFRGKTSAECRLYALQLQPETLPEDRIREVLALLQEETAGKTAEEIALSGVDERMRAGQGTLLLCRCRETALFMARRYPEADFLLEKAADPRAYNGILLYGTARNTCATYRHVVLCDGDIGEGEALRRSCPRAIIYALPQTEALRALLGEMALSREELRACYRVLRARPPRDLAAFAADTGLSPHRAAFALGVFSQIGLLSYCPAPFSAALLPPVPCNPEDSPLFRAARQAKEDDHGIHGL